MPAKPKPEPKLKLPALHRETIHLTINGQREREPITAQVLSGLAIHKPPPGDYSGGSFIVSHIASGVSIAGFRLLRDAKRFLLSLLDIPEIDWTVPRGQLLSGLGTQGQATVRDLKRKIHATGNLLR